MQTIEDYRGDVIYEVYRNGGNVDRIDMERVDRCYYKALDAEVAASREVREQQFQEAQPEESPT